jgi:predicted dehydrogenase
MSNQILRVAVVGIGGFGANTLAACCESDRVELVGVSDKDPRLAGHIEQTLEVPAFTDNRSLLAETRPEAVLLCQPPMAAAELVSACAQRGIHVWKELPLARDLDEGAAMVRCMEQAGLKLAVGTQRRFAPTYRRAHELRERLGEVFLARAHYLFNWGQPLNWRTDRRSAGGGALLELGYHPIDLLGWLFGPPEEVYGCSAVVSSPLDPDAELPRVIHDTDDTAAGVLRFPGGMVATVVTTRCSGPVSEELSLHGLKGSLVAGAQSMVCRDPDGNLIDHLQDQQTPIAAFQAQIEAFAESVLAGDDRPPPCSGRENLLNLAVIEAMYLSARTAQPESISHLLKSHGLEVKDLRVERAEEEPPQTPTGDGSEPA